MSVSLFVTGLLVVFTGMCGKQQAESAMCAQSEMLIARAQLLSIDLLWQQRSMVSLCYCLVLSSVLQQY